MAIKKIVAVRDRALDAFGQPFFIPSNGAAIRSFQDEINNKDSELYKHPDDYDLYELGEYDDNTGTLAQGPEHPRQIAIGKNLKQQ